MSNKKELKDEQLDKTSGGINIFDPSELVVKENPTPKFKEGQNIKYKEHVFTISKVHPQQLLVLYDIYLANPFEAFSGIETTYTNVPEMLLEEY